MVNRIRGVCSGHAISNGRKKSCVDDDEKKMISQYFEI